MLDAVRYELADTNEDAPLLQDEEIEYSIAREAPGLNPPMAGVLSAAAHCMEVLGRLFSAQADQEIGALRITYSKQAEGYEKSATKLRLRAQGLHVPFVGGTSHSEKEGQDLDTDRIVPSFRRDQFISPYSIAPTIRTQITQGEEGD